ncbi:RICIN domain-containing protein [Parafrankia elaeagni]|uniref:RICIN domain-containing protein n=1 Tax=Parafrankia elaeagni TaxID=222534 RepID=UPI001E62A0C8|nr:RICIN domain-containing protein [Parafrankia elaeagni]
MPTTTESGDDVGNNVVDGIYRISINGEQLLTNTGNGPTVLLPENGRGQEWEIQNTGNGTYTIRNASSPEFLGFEGEPDTFEPVRPRPEPREWRIEEGPRPGTFNIAVVDNNELTLGLHPALIYPPLIALSPIFREDRGWNLQPVN